MPHSPGFGAIVGIVAEDGVPKVNAPVRLYDRTTGQLVKEVRSVEDGGYVFSGLNTETDDYIVMATDEDGTPKKNVVAYDRIRPIPAQQGDTYYAAWRLIVGKYNPVRWVCGRFPNQTDQVFGPVNHARENTIAKAESGQIWVHESANLPGDPSLTQLELRSGVAFITGNESNYFQLSNTVANEGATLSIFFVVDFNVAWGYKEYSASNYGNSPGAVGLFLRAKWSGSILTIQLRNRVESTIDDENHWTTICNYTPPGGLTNYHSLTLALYLGGVTKTYLDGLEIASYDTTTFIAVPNSSPTTLEYSYTRASYCKFMDSTYGAGIGQKLAVLGLFKGLFRAQEALELHNAFFTVNPPNVTGYRKEVILDAPQVFYIPNASSGVSNLNPCTLPPGVNETTLLYKNTANYQNTVDRLIPRGTLLLQQPSPITGDVSTDFTNGCYRGPIGANPSRYYFGIEAILKRITTSAPSVEEYIIRVTSNYYNTSYNEFWKFSLSTNRKLQLKLSAAVPENIVTTYSLPDSVFVHIFLQVDRVQGKWFLYINGLLQEQGNTSAFYPAKFYNFNSTENTGSGWLYYMSHYTQETEIGGLWNNSNVMSNNFKGDIAAIAVYSGPTLNDARVLAHYNALGVI